MGRMHDPLLHRDLELTDLYQARPDFEFIPPFPDYTANLVRGSKGGSDPPRKRPLPSLSQTCCRKPHVKGVHQPLTFIPKDCIRVATSLPILPRPRIPRIFPFSSVPMNCNQTSKRQSGHSKHQEWDLGHRARQVEAGLATHLLPFPFAILHGSRCLGNLPARTDTGSVDPHRRCVT